MNEESSSDRPAKEDSSFFARSNVKEEIIPVGGGIPFGVESVTNKDLGIGGAYGAWGKSYDNSNLPEFVEGRMGAPLAENDMMDLSQLGFVSRHHIPNLSNEEHIQVELEVGTRLIKEAAESNGWKPQDGQGLLVGMSGPVATNYVTEI